MTPWSVQLFVHSSRQRLAILYNGLPFFPLKLPLPMCDLDPIYYMIPWANPSPQPKQHIDWFGHFCTAQRRMSLNFNGPALLHTQYSTTPHHIGFTALFPGSPGWAGARRELLDFMVQGKINRGKHTDHPAGRHSIWTNQCPPPPSHHFYRPDALPAAQPTVSKHWRHGTAMRAKGITVLNIKLNSSLPYDAESFFTLSSGPW